MAGSINLDQQRAAFAWQQMADTNLNGEYKTITKSAPALIMNNGLMQTLAYLEGKKGKASILGQHIAQWLQQTQLLDSTRYQDVMQQLQQIDSDKYRRATDETLKYLRWLRQFASTNLEQ